MKRAAALCSYDFLLKDNVKLASSELSIFHEAANTSYLIGT